MISVVIPSKNPVNLAACAAAVRQNEPGARIVVVDDGLGAVKGDVTVVPGIKPFQFSRNVNLGAREALADPRCSGIVILGDDGLLKTAGGFSLLAESARVHPEYGVIAASCNNVGNLNQKPKGIGLRDEKRMVCFICVYIPRSTWEAVGTLDEDFDCYSHQDDDYCLRVRRAGLKIGIHDGCFIDHGSLRSTYRGYGGTAELELGAAIFEQKWGAVGI